MHISQHYHRHQSVSYLSHTPVVFWMNHPCTSFDSMSAMAEWLAEHLGTVVVAVGQRRRSLGGGEAISPFIDSILLKLRVMDFVLPV